MATMIRSANDIAVSTWIYLVMVLGVAYAVYDRYKQYRRLQHIPGPRTTGVSWWWHSLAILSGDSHRWYGDATDKYGSLVRVAPNLLITSSPELWMHINAVRTPYTRAPWYYHAARFEPGKDNVFTECDNDTHELRRKRMASGYAGKENPNLETTIDELVEDFIRLVRSKHAASSASRDTCTPMDLATKIQYLTLDVISAVGLGEAFGDVRTDSDVNDYLKATTDGLYLGNFAFGLGIAWLKEVPIIGPLISPSEADKSGYGRMMAEARKVVEARKAKSQATEGKSDMIASFLRHGMSEDELFQEVFEQILAGSDTTAGSIRFILFYVMTHPRVYKKLQAEIDGACKAGIAPQSPGIISNAEAQKLPYLSAVIREGLRIHPSVVPAFPRVAPNHGDLVTIDEKQYFIPGGTMVGYAAWSMHRNNKAVYGADAGIFRPERWMMADDDPAKSSQLPQMIKTNDLIFGHGRWACLGKTVGMIELYKTVFELLRHFDFALTNPLNPWHLHNSLGLFAIRDMWVDVTDRE